MQVVLIDVVRGKGVDGVYHRNYLGRFDSEVVNAAGGESFGDGLSVCRDFAKIDQRVHGGLSDMRAALCYFFLKYWSTLDGFKRDHEGGDAHPQ